MPDNIPSTTNIANSTKIQAFSSPSYPTASGGITTTNIASSKNIQAYSSQSYPTAQPRHMSNQISIKGSKNIQVFSNTVLDAGTQKTIDLFKELDVEQAKFHIAPHGPRNFLYLAALLFLPYFYSTRAYPVLSSATSLENEIKERFRKAPDPEDRDIRKFENWPAVQNSWDEFLNALTKEWKTLNVVSALLLTAIYNVLLLGGQGSTLTQCTALMSLLSALMSLTLGCLYLIRFETMRRTYKAIQWSSDALKTSHTFLWNISTLLALPSAWLAWSLVFFVVCLMSIVWQPIDVTIGSTSGLGPLHLASKIVVSALLIVGMVHLCFALVAFAGYGSKLDKKLLKNLESLIGDIKPKSAANLATLDNAKPYKNNDSGPHNDEPYNGDDSPDNNSYNGNDGEPPNDSGPSDDSGPKAFNSTRPPSAS